MEDGTDLKSHRNLYRPRRGAGAFSLGAKLPSCWSEAFGCNSVSLDAGPLARATLGIVVSKMNPGTVVVSETGQSCRRSRSFTVMQSSTAAITTTATDPASRRLPAGRRTQWRGTDMHRDDGCGEEHVGDARKAEEEEEEETAPRSRTRLFDTQVTVQAG
jgi:hypothetical protein